MNHNLSGDQPHVDILGAQEYSDGMGDPDQIADSLKIATMARRNSALMLSKRRIKPL